MPAERVAVRRYPYGQLAAHVLGYTGQIIDEEFEAKAGSPKPYTLNDKIGKYGVEKIYEDDLRGTPGSRSIEVDAENQPIRIVERGRRRSPATTSCSTSTSTCRRRPSRRCSPASPSPRTARAPAASRRRRREKGSTVVLDPKTGGVIAMASFPTFNPADFVDGISDIEWAALTAEENNTPLNNWAIQGQYAPGSTFKPFSAVAGARVGARSPPTPPCTTTASTRCRTAAATRARSATTTARPTAWSTCAGRSPCRPTSTTTASAPSSGSSRTASAGPSGYADLLKQWGFDSDTGIDLSSEQAGRIPSPAWLADYCEQRRAASTAPTAGAPATT